MKNKNQGFTLIELLVVIAIIGILASMLLPTLAKAKTKANRLKCTGNLKSVAQAFQSYSSAYEGTVPQLDAENTNANGHRVCKAKGYGNWDQAHAIVGWAQGFEIRNTLAQISVLASPLDPKTISSQRRYGNRTNGGRFQSFTEMGGGIGWNTRMDRLSQSYTIWGQGDTAVSATVLASTRNNNASGVNEYRAYNKMWSESKNNRWNYPNRGQLERHWGTAGGHGFAAYASLGDLAAGTDPVFNVSFYGPGNKNHSLTGLGTDEANWVTSDGATKQGSASDFNTQLSEAARSKGEGQDPNPGLNAHFLRPQQ
jgi:prepilin-type N-terminal cleavage/methylation domain-containing protein